MSASSPNRLLRGTLDVLLLKTLSWGPLHGYAVSRSIRLTSGDDLKVDEGALYPALRRLEGKGYLASYWALTDQQREARFYELTPEGRRQLDLEVTEWNRYVAAMARVLRADGPRLAEES